MINTNRLNSIQSVVFDDFNIIEMDMLINISKLLNASLDVNESNISKWYDEMVLKNKKLNSDQLKVIKKYEKKVKKDIAEMYELIGFETMDHDEKTYLKAVQQGLLSANPTPYTESNAVLNILKTSIKNADDAYNLIRTSAIESSSKEFLRTLSKVQVEVSTGVRDYNSAIRLATRQLSDYGITGQTYVSDSGKTIRYSMESAVRREIVSPTVKTTGDMQIERMGEYGNNHVEVSSHVGARPDHARWQGYVYMLVGSNSKYRNLTEATNYGDVAGLQGANCRHFFYPFVPGISERTFKHYNAEENDVIYKESQTQRRLERNVVKNKRRVVLSDYTNDQVGFKNESIKLKKSRVELENFMKETGRTQQTRLFVHGFDVSLSNKANAVVR